jgi:hypothetical protein
MPRQDAQLATKTCPENAADAEPVRWTESFTAADAASARSPAAQGEINFIN